MEFKVAVTTELIITSFSVNYWFWIIGPSIFAGADLIILGSVVAGMIKIALGELAYIAVKIQCIFLHRF